MPPQMPISRKYQEPSIDTPKCSANNNHKDSLSIQFGTMPLNYCRVHRHRFQEGSYVSHRTKSKKYQKLWWNIYKEELSDRGSDLMWQMFSSSRRRMANYVQYKITILLINGR